MAMTFASLIDAAYPAFGLNDPAGQVAHRLADSGLASAPVIDGRRYVGMVTLSGLLSGRRGWPPAKMTLRETALDAVPAFGEEARLFESLGAVIAVGVELIPVVDHDGGYAGVVSRSVILDHMAAYFHPEGGCSSIEIEVPPPGARFSEIIAAIEKNDASIVSFSVGPSGKASESQIVFFRVLTHDFFRLVRNLERYGYLVSYHSPFPDSGFDEMREKALEFIRYMDM
jgi:CBS domain-containing protein